MDLKHDNQGFLVGELLSGQQEALQYQHTGLNYWKNIDRNVRNIARAVGAESINSRVAAPSGRKSGPSGAFDSGRHGRTAAQPRDAATGRFVSSSRAVAPQRMRAEREGPAGPKQRTQVAVVAAAAAKAAVASRDGRGRFLGTGGRNSDGEDATAPQGIGARLAERLGGLKDALAGAVHGSQQMDPALAAANEVKDAVTPIGRGFSVFFGTSAEKKKERWYRRLIAAITGKKTGPADGGGKATPGEGAPIGAVAGGVARMLPMMLTGLIGLMGAGLAAFVGTKIGGAIYDWLDKSGIATKIFDLFDAAVAWVKEKVQTAKQAYNEFDSSRQLARAGIGGSVPVLDASGRNINDPRRLDLPAPSDTLAQKVGRFVGSWQHGGDVARAEGQRSGVENRALTVGNKWSQGNIGNLSDAQTRALVASTVATESKGGLLGLVNNAGYMGRYQAGAGWLADAGLIKGGGDAVKAAMKADGYSREYDWGKSGGMTRFLQNDSNWNNGMSYRGFLASGQAQDAAFKANSDKAYADMVRKGIITPGTSSEEVAGLLKARHLAGMGGAEAVAAGGTGPTDANGTTARKYFDDVVKDRGGFLATYAGGAPTTGVATTRAVSVPSPVPDKLPAAQVVETPPATNTDKDKPVRAVMREPIGQDVGDRNIAHIVSGGIGG